MALNAPVGTGWESANPIEIVYVLPIHWVPGERKGEQNCSVAPFSGYALPFYLKANVNDMWELQSSQKCSKWQLHIQLTGVWRRASCD